MERGSDTRKYCQERESSTGGEGNITKSIILCFLLFIMTALPVRTATGATYLFSGTVTDYRIFGTETPEVYIGQRFQGIFTYSFNAPPVPYYISQDQANYDNGQFSIIEYFVNFGGWNISGTSPNVFIGNNTRYGDSFSLNDWNPVLYIDQVGYAGGGDWLNIGLGNSNGSAFDSTAVPEMLNVLAFDSMGFGYTSSGSPSMGPLYRMDVNGTIDSLTAVPVPEPSSIVLLGSGLAGLIGYGRRTVRSKKIRREW